VFCIRLIAPQRAVAFFVSCALQHISWKVWAGPNVAYVTSCTFADEEVEYRGEEVFDSEELAALLPPLAGADLANPPGLRRSRGAVINDTLTIRAMFLLPKNSATAVDEGVPSDAAAHVLKQMLSLGKHTDVVLRTADGVELRAHKVRSVHVPLPACGVGAAALAGSECALCCCCVRVCAQAVLSVRSPVFDAMFSHSMRENKENVVSVSHG
jgi:hypothetical protein